MSSKTGGFSPKRLARMHNTLIRHVDSSGRLPGLVALISRRGVEHVDAIGTLAFDSTAPMRRDTILRLASVTKPITAVAAMTLVEECKLRLDDPVDEFLPEQSNRRVLRTIDSERDDTVPVRHSTRGHPPGMNGPKKSGRSPSASASLSLFAVCAACRFR